VAVGTKDGGVTYDVAYSVVTVGGATVTNRNSAYALASSNHCTTVAVSFQVVLIVGRTKAIAPINEAEALNANCPACMTTALADQIVVTLSAAPSKALLSTLTADLRQLGDLSALGAGGTPTAIAAEVDEVQQQIDTALKQSGLLPKSTKSGGAANQSTTSSSTTAAAASSASTTIAAGSATQSTSTAAPAATSPAANSSATSSTAATTTTSTSSTAASSTTTGAASTTTAAP
jgi:putative peptide zinc metalloprotease protein